jgi:competence protein ComEC
MRLLFRFLLLCSLAFALIGCGTLTPAPLAFDQASLVSAASPNYQSPTPSRQLRVHFIDVGQGDSILIQAPSGATMLIDGGYGGSGALAYLQAQGVTKIDVMVASHPHADHIGGLVDVLRAMPVGAVWTSGASHTTGVFEQFLDAIADAKAPYHEAKHGDVILLDDLRFEVLHSDPAAGDLNDSSVVLHLVDGKVSFLFTGDAERSAEQAMLREEKDRLASTILKVGHHGSYTSSSPEFLAAVRPAIAVYSAGAHNSYGHPHASTIQNLTRVGATIYGTAKDGTVVISTDGTTYTVTTARDSNTSLAASPAATVPPTSVPSLTPTPLPQSPVPNPRKPAANPCKQRVDAAAAPNAPIVIASVDKIAEVVAIRNIGASAVDLTDWTICSLLGSQLHAHLQGVLAAGEAREVPSQAARAIWNNRSKERAAVYNSAGQLISYWSEEAR